MLRYCLSNIFLPSSAMMVGAAKLLSMTAFPPTQASATQVSSGWGLLPSLANTTIHHTKGQVVMVAIGHHD
jgi:hypothetical protein